MEGDLLGVGFESEETTAPSSTGRQPQPQTFAPVPASAAQQQQPRQTSSSPASTAAQEPASGANNSSSVQAPNQFSQPQIWKPTQEEAQLANPVLKEIKEKFGGSWRLARSDPYHEYLKAVGVGIFNRQVAGRAVPDQVITVKNEEIHIGFHASLYNQNYIFRLEESVENFVEKSRQSVFCSYKNGKLTLQMTPIDQGFNKTQEVERYINENNEMVMIYTAGSAVCRRYFIKLPDVTLPPNIVG